MLAVLTSGLGIYYKMFTLFAKYDDEGYVLIGVRSLLHGHRLYDEVYSQYGPFFYMVHWTIYSLLGQSPSHDVQRFIGVALWILSSILWGRAVYLLTDSLLWSGLGFYLGVRILAFFPWSAGHPEELCMLLLSATAVLACRMRSDRSAGTLAGLGGLLAAIILTKVNLGLYVGLALGLTLLKTTRPSLARYAGIISVACVSLILPAALMSQMWDFTWGREYTFVATVAIGTAILIATTLEPPHFMTARLWWTVVVSCLGGLVLIVLPFSINGTTLGALLQMTVFQHAGTARQWYIPPPITGKVLVEAVISPLVAAAAYFRCRNLTSAGHPAMPQAAGVDWLGYVLLACKALVGFTCFFVLAKWSIEPNNPLLFRYCAPFAWLLLVPPMDGSALPARAGRIAVCLLAVFVYLYAYPVGGSQLAFAGLPGGIVALVMFRDALLEIVALAPAIAPSPEKLRIAAALGFVFVAFLLVRELSEGYQYYTANISLAMPGAERIRVRLRERVAYHWVLDHVNSCGSIYSMPGLYSLNVWADKDPPTALTAGNWVGLLNPDQQRTVIRDLSKAPDLCIVYSPTMIEFWRRGQDLKQSPLAQYILGEFAPVAQAGGFSILKRRPRIICRSAVAGSLPTPLPE